jgi:protocatechuate 4,5-dioxygenase beta chain
MIGLGLASSHAPGMWRPPELQNDIWKRFPEQVTSQLPYTAKLEMESLELRQEHYERAHAAFAALREQVQAYRPDVIIMIGDDQRDMFDESNDPIFSIYTGEEPIWGLDVRDRMSRPTLNFNDPDPPVKRIEWQNHAELARYLHKGLVKRGFDVANVGKFVPRGNPKNGVSHMVANLAPEIDPSRQIPLVCVFLNEYYPPLPSAARCAALGEAIAAVMADRPERMVIYASGGLSHFPGEYNVGWIDHALDKWMLERFASNSLDELTHLFTFDSDMLRAGTGEVRAWIAVAAAMKRQAKVVEYVPIHSTLTGCGFVYWPAVESPAVEAAQAAVAARA